MFVYKKDRLKQEVINEDGKFFYQLFHPTSGMSIKTEITNNDSSNKDSKKYVVFKENEDGQYVIYEEFSVAKKGEIETFKEAINFFEDKIYESLQEPKPNTTPPPSQDEDEEQEKIKELPRVGDIVQIGKKYGRVLEVDEQSRDIRVSSLTKDEAMAILKRQRNQLIEDSVSGQSSGSIEDIIRNALENNSDESSTLSVIQDTLQDLMTDNKSSFTEMQDGGEVISLKSYNVDDDNVIILRVSPPPSSGGEPPTDPPPPNDEPKPENIKDPFEDDQRDDDDKRDDKKGDDEKGDDKKGDDKKGDDKKGDDKKGDDEKGDDEKGDDEKGDDERGGDERGRDEKGRDSDDDDGDFDFDEDDFSDIDLDELLSGAEKELQQSLSGLEDKRIEGDIEDIARFFGTNVNELKSQLRTKELARIGIGRNQLFATDNKERIENALNKIFE